MGFKYIVFEVETDVVGIRRLPIIFPDQLVHVSVAAAITLLPSFLKARSVRIASAGEISLTAQSCSGHSETLNVESDPDDAELINLFPWCNGIEMPDEFKQHILSALADARATAPEKQ